MCTQPLQHIVQLFEVEKLPSIGQLPKGNVDSFYNEVVLRLEHILSKSFEVWTWHADRRIMPTEQRELLVNYKKKLSSLVGHINKPPGGNYWAYKYIESFRLAAEHKKLKGKFLDEDSEIYASIEIDGASLRGVLENHILFIDKALTNNNHGRAVTNDNFVKEKILYELGTLWECCAFNPGILRVSKNPDIDKSRFYNYLTLSFSYISLTLPSPDTTNKYLASVRDK